LRNGYFTLLATSLRYEFWSDFYSWVLIVIIMTVNEMVYMKTREERK